MLSKVVSSTILKVFGMTRPGIEPRSPGPLANTLTAGPMSRLVDRKRAHCDISWGGQSLRHFFLTLSDTLFSVDFSIPSQAAPLTGALEFTDCIFSKGTLPDKESLGDYIKQSAGEASVMQAF